LWLSAGVDDGKSFVLTLLTRLADSAKFVDMVASFDVGFTTAASLDATFTGASALFAAESMFPLLPFPPPLPVELPKLEIAEPSKLSA
jgi:hypothetical protein